MTDHTYTTEAYLLDVFSTGKYEFLHNKGMGVKGIRFRPDFRFEELGLVVEFDGAAHYTKSSRIFKDIEKDHVLKQLGYKVIRIPYFIQLTYDVYMSLFVDNGYDLGVDETLLISNYPHGFIDKNATLPIDFCVLGHESFMLDMAYTFNGQMYDVFGSLIDKEQTGTPAYPRKTILPHSPDMLWSGFNDSGYDCHGMFKLIRESLNT